MANVISTENIMKITIRMIKIKTKKEERKKERKIERRKEGKKEMMA